MLASSNGLRHQLCPHFNSGQEKETCLRGSGKKCGYDLQHLCSTCACPGHGAHRCRDKIRDDSTPNPDNVIIRHCDPRDAQHAGSTPEIFVTSPPYHTAQAAIRRDSKRGRAPARVFHVLWDHSEQLSARYKQYRQKTRDTKTREKKDVWPDDIEEAFQIGLRCYARRGRKKEELHGKQCGGNEFISDWIWIATNEWRDRKQVSSHIQVLKGYMTNNPRWLDLLKGDPDWLKGKGPRPSRQTRALSPLQDPSVQLDESGIVPYGSFQQRPSPALDLLPSNVALGPTIKSVRFEMTRYFLPSQHEPPQSASNSKVHHRYTSIQSEMGSAPRQLDSIPQWRSKYPHLAPFDPAGWPIPIFLFESSLDLTEDVPSDKTAIRVEFVIDFAQAAGFQGWHSRTRVQDNTGSQAVQEKEIECASIQDNFGQIRPRIGPEQSLTLTPHFRAQYWAQTICDIHNRRREVPPNDSAEMKRYEDDTRQFVNSISLTQELWATSTVPGSSPRRMAILLWKFQQTHGNETPTTSWRRMTSGPPHLPATNPEGSSLQNPYDGGRPLEPGYDQNGRSPSQMLGHPQSGVEPYPGHLESNMMPPTLHPISTANGIPRGANDDGSFPSAVSSSFPSAISDSIHSGTSQNTPLESSNSSYSRFSSYGPQGSMYPVDCPPADYKVPQMSMDPSGQMQYSEQRPKYLYDEQMPHMGSKMAGYPSYDANNHMQPPVDSAMTAHQSSYAAPSVHPPYQNQDGPRQVDANGRTVGSESYDAPILAPRAQMVTQNQVMHLQQYPDMNGDMVNGENGKMGSNDYHQQGHLATEQGQSAQIYNGSQVAPGHRGNYGPVPSGWEMLPPPEPQSHYQYGNQHYPPVVESTPEDVNRWFFGAKKAVPYMAPVAQDRHFHSVVASSADIPSEPHGKILGPVEDERQQQASPREGYSQEGQPAASS